MSQLALVHPLILQIKRKEKQYLKIKEKRRKRKEIMT